MASNTELIRTAVAKAFGVADIRGVAKAERVTADLLGRYLGMVDDQVAVELGWQHASSVLFARAWCEGRVEDSADGPALTEKAEQELIGLLFDAG